MVEPIIIFFICIVIPLIPALIFMKGKTRTTVLFMLIGIYICLFSSFVNGYIKNISGMEKYNMTILVTPMIEELLKIIPIVVYVFLFKPQKFDLLTASVMVGIGFAILENTYILSSCVEDVTIRLAIVRGMGAGLMHGTCTLITGFGLTYFYLRRKLAFAGTYALLLFSIIYHSCYNLLIQSEYDFLGLFLPAFTVAVIGLVVYLNKSNNKKTEQTVK